MDLFPSHSAAPLFISGSEGVVPGPECEKDNLSGVDGGTNAGFSVQLEALHGKQIPVRRRLLYACRINGSLPCEGEEYRL